MNLVALQDVEFKTCLQLIKQNVCKTCGPVPAQGWIWSNQPKFGPD